MRSPCSLAHAETRDATWAALHALYASGRNKNKVLKFDKFRSSLQVRALLLLLLSSLLGQLHQTGRPFHTENGQRNPLPRSLNSLVWSRILADYVEFVRTTDAGDSLEAAIDMSTLFVDTFWRPQLTPSAPQVVPALPTATEVASNASVPALGSGSTTEHARGRNGVGAALLASDTRHPVLTSSAGAGSISSMGLAEGMHAGNDMIEAVLGGARRRRMTESGGDASPTSVVMDDN
ncbi:hypothetical protein EON66_06385, partial [archaeon]